MKNQLIVELDTLPELRSIYISARALLDDIKHRYPGEELRCKYMRALDEACTDYEITYMKMR